MSVQERVGKDCAFPSKFMVLKLAYRKNVDQYSEKVHVSMGTDKEL